MLKNHKPAPLSKMNTIDYCSKHPKIIAEFFCVKDECCICSTCVILEHDGHQPIDVQKGRQNLQSHLKALNISKDFVSIKNSIKKIDEKIDEEKSNYEKEKLELEKKFIKNVNVLQISKLELNKSFEMLEKFKENLKSEMSSMQFGSMLQKWNWCQC
jgi:hypothetical protein